MKIQFRNTEIHYTTSGAGSPLVLLHGFLESSAIWNHYLPGLSEHFQIITIDLPGHGKSGCVDDTHSMELMAEAVKHVLDELKLSKVHVMGHSMGGYVALALLEKFPQMIASFRLLNSTPEADSAEKKENRERSEEVVRRNKKAYISTAIPNLASPANRKILAPELEKLKLEAMAFSERGIIAALRGMKIRPDRKEVLSSFSGPKYFITGKEDYLLDAAWQKQLATQCGCGFEAVEGGHLSYMEDSAQVLNLCISSKK